MSVDWESVSKTTPTVGLSFVVVITTLFFEGFGLFHGFSREVDDVVLGRILGTLDSLSALVMAYWFGSTRGSADKDATIAGMAVGTPTAQVPAMEVK